MSLLTPVGLLARIREEAEKWDDQKRRYWMFTEIALTASNAANDWRKLESDIEAELLAESEAMFNHYHPNPATDAAPVNGQQGET